MNNVSDDVFFLGLGALICALLFTQAQRLYYSVTSRAGALRLGQRIALWLAAYRAQRAVDRALRGSPALNQAAADIQAAPHVPRASR